MKNHFSKHLIYHYAGLLIIAALVIWISYNSSKHKKYVGSRVHDLQTEDVLVLKISKKEYAFALVDTVVRDTIYFKNSNYTFNQKPTKSNYDDGLQLKKDFFDKEIYFYTQHEVDSLFKLNELDIFEK